MTTRGLTEHPHYRVRYPNGMPLRVEITEPIGPKGEPGSVVEYWQNPDGSERREFKYALRPAVMVAAIGADGKAIACDRRIPGFDGLQCVSGTFTEDDRDPLEVAKRALLAKTGCEGTLQLIGSDFENTKRGVRVWHYVLATGCQMIDDPTEKGSLRADFGSLLAIRRAITERYFGNPGLAQRGHNSYMVVNLAIDWIARNQPGS